MQNIRPWFWFETQAEEAANFYVSIFSNSRIIEVSRYGPEGPGPEGAVLLVRFTIDGTDAMAINMFDNEHRGVSTMYANIRGGQAEVDRVWDKLSEGGRLIACGWLVDRYGNWWNVVPAEFEEMLADSNDERRSRVMQAMMQMIKLDIAELQRAYDGA
jgi:predicted 3-demethylubiquinone-9 3-methyltransferase (glyoxalase superfamily)